MPKLSKEDEQTATLLLAGAFLSGMLANPSITTSVNTNDDQKIDAAIKMAKKFMAKCERLD